MLTMIAGKSPPNGLWIRKEPISATILCPEGLLGEASIQPKKPGKRWRPFSSDNGPRKVLLPRCALTLVIPTDFKVHLIPRDCPRIAWNPHLFRGRSSVCPSLVSGSSYRSVDLMTFCDSIEGSLGSAAPPWCIAPHLDRPMNAVFLSSL